MAYFKNLPYRTSVAQQEKKKKILHTYRTYVLFIEWYALNVPYLKGTIRWPIKALNVSYGMLVKNCRSFLEVLVFRALIVKI